MGLSNEHGHLVLAPGNKSELAVGYSTLYGDSVGGFAPIKDLPKTWVWRLARWRNADAEARGEKAPIPEASISKEPSAELRPGQLDTDSLPPYDVLDDILDDYVEQDRGSRRAAGGRLRPGRGRARAAADRPGRVQASAVPTRPEDLLQGVRSRPAAAHHQPLAGARAPPLTGVPQEERQGTGMSETDRPDPAPESTAPYGSGPAAAGPPLPSRRASASGCTTCGR